VLWRRRDRPLTARCRGWVSAFDDEEAFVRALPGAANEVDWWFSKEMKILAGGHRGLKTHAVGGHSRRRLVFVCQGQRSILPRTPRWRCRS
jgi:hypothetical protein